METHELPLFSLPDARGRPLGTATLLQRREELVLALVHPPGCGPCGSLLRALGDRARAGGLSGAQTLVVFMGRGAAAGEPLSAVGDPDGRVASKLSDAMSREPGEPLLVVSDRFGTAYSARPIHSAPADLLLADAGEWVDFIQQQCPE
jgi:hypothetical protein